jgi:hypothetical protein
MILFLQRDEAERLQNAVRPPLRGVKNFGHAVHRPGLRLKSNFYEVALRQRLRQLQQSASHGNGLEFSFCAASVL